MPSDARPAPPAARVTSFGRHKIRIVLILLVFLVFLLHVTGLVEFRLDLGSDLALRFNVLTQMLDQGAVPEILKSGDFIIFALTGVVLSVLLPVLTPIQASALTFVCMVLPIYHEYAYPLKKDFIPFEYTLLTILILFAVNVLASYFAETHAKQKLLSVFGQYVPREVVDSISRHPENFSLEGEARELTVFFCDIMNFSRISELLDPRQLAQMLNTYFTEMTRILHRHGATIDKYIGDAIMAFWGAPLPQPDHATRALGAGIEMQRALERLREDFSKRGWPQLNVGIGINTGVMNVGNMGSQFRVAYTVVGDAVNLGARIEHLTRNYAAGIIVSEATRNAIPDMVFRELDHVRVKGKGAATRIYEPLCSAVQADQVLRDALEQHREALQCYYNGEWDQAIELFTELKRSRLPAPYYDVMISRVMALKAQPPPGDWGGITRLESV
jgi:adenylate cyclase